MPLRLGTPVDGSPQLGVDPNGDDLGRSSAHERTPSPVWFQHLDVVVLGGDVFGDGFDLGVRRRSS